MAQWFLCHFLTSTFLVMVSGGNYEPSHVVKQFHGFPHLNQHLHSVNNEFAITSESRWNSYTDSLVPFPVITGICGVLLVLIPVGVLVSRYWCNCAKCMPKVVHEYLQTMMARSPSRNSTFIEVAMYRQCALFSFVACLIVVMIVNQGVFLGETPRNHSVQRAKDSLSSMKQTFNDLTHQGYGLQDTGAVIEDDLAAALPTCPEAQSLFEPLVVYQQSIITYLEIVEPLPSRLGDVESYLYYWGVTFRNQMIWLIYGMVWMILGIFFMSICVQSQGSLKVGIGIGFFFTAALFSLLAALIYLLMMSADYCMEPTSNALGLCEPDYRPVATYYSSCNGTNPLTEPLETALISIQVIDFSISELSKPSGACPLNPYLLHCATMVDYVQGNLTLVAESALCPPVRDEWNNFFHDAVCHDGFQAMFVTWVADYVTIISLYLTLLVGCLSYQYIGTQWRLDFEDLEEANAQPRDQNEYFYPRSLDAADRVHSTPFSYFHSKASRSCAGGRGGGSDGSGSGRSPMGEYNFFSSYLDSNAVAPLLSSYFSQDSDESQQLREEEEEEQRQLDTRRQSQRKSGRQQQQLFSQGRGGGGGGGSNRSSARLTPDLFPSPHYPKY